MIDMDELALLIVCEKCKARPNKPCVTANGNPAPRPHSNRREPFQRCYNAGIEQGRGEAAAVDGARTMRTLRPKVSDGPIRHIA